MRNTGYPNQDMVAAHDKCKCTSPTSIIPNDTFLADDPGPETSPLGDLTERQSHDRSETRLCVKRGDSLSSLSRKRKTTGIPKYDTFVPGLRVRCDIDREAQTQEASFSKERRLLTYKQLTSVFIRAYVILAIATMAVYEVFEPSPSFRSNHVRRNIDRKFFQKQHNPEEMITTVALEINADEVTKPEVLLVEKRTSFSHEIPEAEDELERRQRRLQEARNHVVAPLDPIDREKYTIRMNTWKRNEQLIASINHHSRCEGVAQIQIVWCNMEEEPPSEVVNHPSGKVVVEKHEVNTLNERFNVLTPPPTKGILSMDDDILRSCEALDSGFFRWTKSPDSIVGYDARLHGIKDDESGWKYLGKSDTYKADEYSLILLRAAFVHRDYMNLYMSHLPRAIFDFVAAEFNCEDVAMSYFISYITNGKPPLIPDLWAVEAITKLYTPAGISLNDEDHKAKRDQCVTDFAKELGLHSGEGALKSFKLKRDPVFQHGADVDDPDEATITTREVALNEGIADFLNCDHSAWKWNVIAIQDAFQKGMIRNTVPFEELKKRNRTKKALSREESYFALAAYKDDLTEEQRAIFDHMKEELNTRSWFKKECKGLMAGNADKKKGLTQKLQRRLLCN